MGTPLSQRWLLLGAVNEGPRAGWALTQPEQAVMVLGPPRSGKTTSLVVPNILVAPGPVVSTSTKPDVLLATADVRAAMGRCWLYDPTGQRPGPAGAEALRWSPLVGAEAWDVAVRTAKTLVGATVSAPRANEAFWTTRAETLLAPLLHAAALDTNADMADVVHWVNRRRSAEAFELLEAAGASRALDDLLSVQEAESRETSGVWSTAAACLSAYRTEAALATTRQPNFDPDAFVASTDSVFICAAGSHQAAVAPLVSGLVEQVVNARYELETRCAMAGRAVPAPVLLALDEVANIAPLPELPRILSEGGGQGVLVLACFQDLSQARARWGEAASGFLSLFGTKVVLPGIGEPQTLAALSQLCGVGEAAVDSVQWSGLRTTTGRSSRRQERLSAEEVRRGRSGAALVIESHRAARWVGLVPPGVSLRPDPARSRLTGRAAPGPERSQPARGWER